MANQYSHYSACTRTTTTFHPLLTNMWCINCQQDVPAIAHGDMARCAQCGRFLKRRPEAPALSLGESWSESASSAPELPLSVAETTPLLPITPIASAVELENDWTLQQRVRHLQRRLRKDEASLTPASFHNELLSPSTVPSLSASHNNQLARMPGRFSAVHCLVRDHHRIADFPRRRHTSRLVVHRRQPRTLEPWPATGHRRSIRPPLWPRAATQSPLASQPPGNADSGNYRSTVAAEQPNVHSRSRPSQ